MMRDLGVALAITTLAHGHIGMVFALGNVESCVQFSDLVEHRFGRSHLIPHLILSKYLT